MQVKIIIRRILIMAATQIVNKKTTTIKTSGRGVKITNLQKQSKNNKSNTNKQTRTRKVRVKKK